MPQCGPVGHKECHRASTSDKATVAMTAEDKKKSSACLSTDQSKNLVQDTKMSKPPRVPASVRDGSFLTDDSSSPPLATPAPSSQ